LYRWRGFAPKTGPVSKSKGPKKVAGLIEEACRSRNAAKNIGDLKMEDFHLGSGISVLGQYELQIEFVLANFMGAFSRALGVA
jgi:hypothetical protein